MKLIEQHQIFGGSQQVWAHHAQTLQCEMKFAVYLPDNPENQPLGVIYWLSGLTCTEQISLPNRASGVMRQNIKWLWSPPIPALAESKCRTVPLMI
ncbi:putative esterase [Neisseria gonorrhoeae]|uniref:S-formylglutathione hydrolase n=1 Tax=Neisseria gonorrhoeae TaxID=485 RepID=A0A378VZG5_NEIGO|nr:putative esterase [Neisseria gonorrhoeae]